MRSLAPWTIVTVLACGAPPRAAPRAAPVALAPAPSSAPEPSTALVVGVAPPSVPEAAADTEPEGCAAEMYLDNAPGTHGLFAFEDAHGRYGFRDALGKVVIPPRFRFAYEFFAGGVTGAVDDAGFLFIDTSGRELARAFPYDNGPDYFSEGLARIVKRGKVGYIDQSGRIVVPPRFDFALPFCEGRAVVCNGCTERGAGDEREIAGGSWGYVDRDGRLVIPLQFDAAESFDRGGARVTRGGRTWTIDADGRPLSEGGAP